MIRERSIFTDPMGSAVQGDLSIEIHVVTDWRRPEN